MEPSHDQNLASLKEMGSSSSKARSSPTSNPFSRPAHLGPSPPTRRPAAVPVEPPPAYTPPPPAYTENAPTSSSSAPLGSDDRYSFLGQFDTKFVIDDSGSMAGRSWRETAAALEAITPVCTKYDADGIDIHFLNAPQQDHFFNVRSVEQVQRIFREQKPYGSTPTGTKLNQILRPYLRDLETKGSDEVKPLNIIVITDGVASDDVESVVIATAKKLEKLDAPAWQVGIQFFQVGNEPEAAAALKELDDDLIGENCPRDIVDTVPFNGDGALSAEGILKVVLGSVNRKIDRKRNSIDEMRVR